MANLNEAMDAAIEKIAQTYLGIETIDVTDDEEIPEMKLALIIRAMRKAYEAGHAAAKKDTTK